MENDEKMFETKGHSSISGVAYRDGVSGGRSECTGEYKRNTWDREQHILHNNMVPTICGNKMGNLKTLLIAIAVISACAIFIALFISAYTQLGIPEKRPVFKIEDETVKEDLIRRGLMGEGYINLGGVEELIKEGVYRISPDGTLELVHAPSE